MVTITHEDSRCALDSGHHGDCVPKAASEVGRTRFCLCVAGGHWTYPTDAS